MEKNRIMSDIKPNRNLMGEGTRPVDKSSWQIAKTFKNAGTRPIEASPDYLNPDELSKNISAEETVVIPPGDSKVISQHPLVEVRNLPNEV